MLRTLMVVIGISAIAILGFLIDTQSRPPTRRQSPKDRPAPTLIFAAGRVEGLTREIELRPQHEGRVVEILVEEGQTVAAGQPLLLLDADRYRHEVELAQAEMQLAQAELERLKNGARAQERTEADAMHEAIIAELEQAQRDVERLRRLRRDNAISQQELDDKESDVKTLQAKAKASSARTELIKADARPDEIAIKHAKIAAAQARWRLAQVHLDRATLKAGVAGQVLKLNVELGEMASPETAEACIILADTSRYRVRAYVEELDAPRVRQNMPAEVRADGLPKQMFSGRVTHLSPRMSRKEVWTDEPTERADTKTREIWVDLDDVSEMVVGLRVDVMIDTSEQHN